MSKIKHERTADCVVAGYRVHKSGPDAIGSLLLGLFDDRGVLASVGRVGAFPMAVRRELFVELQPLVTTFEGHPWNWAAHEQGERTPRKNESSRWNAGKDLSFVPLRPERVVEVRYDYMEGVRFRHTAQFVRWRPDREPESCTYAQLERPGRLPPRRRASPAPDRHRCASVVTCRARPVPSWRPPGADRARRPARAGRPAARGAVLRHQPRPGHRASPGTTSAVPATGSGRRCTGPGSPRACCGPPSRASCAGSGSGSRTWSRGRRRGRTS